MIIKPKFGGKPPRPGNSAGVPLPPPTPAPLKRRIYRFLGRAIIARSLSIDPKSPRGGSINLARRGASRCISARPVARPSRGLKIPLRPLSLSLAPLHFAIHRNPRSRRDVRACVCVHARERVCVCGWARVYTRVYVCVHASERERAGVRAKRRPCPTGYYFVTDDF